MTDRPPVTTFYSFKGGVGRTQAVVNVGARLANRGFRVLLVDFDLEAPGLTWLLGDPGPGVVDLLAGAKASGAAADLFTMRPPEILERYSQVIEPGSKPHPGGSLRVMPAGKTDEGYGTRLSALNLGALYAEGTGFPLIQHFKDALQTTGALDFILVDSRTGFSDESGICTRDLADALVVIAGLNRQNREGTASFLSSLAKQGKRPLTIVSSPVPNGEDEAVNAAEEALVASLAAAWCDEKLAVATRIPYHPALALSEGVRAGGGGHTPLESAYDTLAGCVVDRLGMGATPLTRRLRKALAEREIPAALALIPRLARLHPDALEKVALSQEMRGLLQTGTGQALEPLLYEWLPQDSWVSGDVAVELSRAGLESARRWYERALQASPEDATMLGNYANLLTEVLGEFDTAERYYQRAEDVDPHDVHVLTHHALFQTRIRRNHDEAERLYERALQADPENPTALGNFAVFQLEVRRDTKRARALLERATIVPEPEGLALVHHALLLMSEGEATRALAMLQSAIEQHPTDPEVLGTFASFLVSTGDLEGARAQYDAAIRLSPRHANNLGNAALPNLLLGEIGRGRTLIARAREIPVRQPELDLEMCFYELAFGLREGARADVIHLLESGVRSPEWDLTLAVEAARRRGDPAADFVEVAAEVIGERAQLSTLLSLVGAN
ncbi:MAG: tetratricopeptide repeat protein [Alphaproteobacteria bacterium]|nr:tetratricopeptide repeat protein [Alphaproteobacteria bacterium]